MGRMEIISRTENTDISGLMHRYTFTRENAEGNRSEENQSRKKNQSQEGARPISQP
jgi:hypothetical protein